MHEDTGAPRRHEAHRVSVVGYAAGFGAAIMTLAGTVLHFAFPDTPDLLHFGGTFLLGGVVGALWARAREVSLRA